MADPISSTRGPMLNQTGLAKHFGVSVMAIWRWRRDLSDFPPSVEIAGRLYWSLEAIEAWKAERLADRARQPVKQGARTDQARSQAIRRRNRQKPPSPTAQEPAPKGKQRGQR
jgi:predicted DNA-binding transcriptional regulator AlpA